MKKAIFFLPLFLLLTASVFAQKTDTAKAAITKDYKVYDMVSIEKLPVFPGGEDALFKYISKNLIYPKAAMASNIEGRVTVQFIVDQDGRVTDVTVKKGIKGDHDACNNEAVRVVKSLPKFIPGMQNGKPVRVFYSLPIIFKLTGDEPQTK